MQIGSRFGSVFVPLIISNFYTVSVSFIIIITFRALTFLFYNTLPVYKLHKPSIDSLEERERSHIRIQTPNLQTCQLQTTTCNG